MKKLFITGTDTDAGKTVASKAVLQRLAQQQLSTLAMKPVASGCEWQNERLVNSDALVLRQAMTMDCDYALTNPYTFEPAIAPHIAAALQNQTIEKFVILEHFQQLCDAQPDAIVIEGAGGWALPLSDQLQMPEVVGDMEAEVILVIGLKLGCLNHAQLSARAITAQGFALKGWIAVDTETKSMPYRQQNLETLVKTLDAPCLGEIPYCADWQERDLGDYLRPL